MNIAEQLRKAVLQAAIQGKLTEQLPEDGNAENLLSIIETKKTKLIKNKIISNDKNIKPISTEEIHFDIPDTWKWVRFGEVVHYNMGKTPPRNEEKYWNKADFSWVSISDMVEDGYIQKTREFVSDLANHEIFKNRISTKGTLLMSFKLTVGRVSILDIDAYHNEAIISIYPHEDSHVLRDYLFKILPFISEWGNTKSAIKGKTLNSNSISNLLVPLAPLSEQKRIVEKLDQILPMIDALEKDENMLSEVVSQIPEKMKASILQAAIQGKLTEQLPVDGNAEDELRKFLGKQYKVIAESDYPFEIPENWSCISLKQITDIKNGFTPLKSNVEFWNSKDIPWFTINDIRKQGRIINKTDQYITHRAIGDGKRIVPKNSVLLCCTASIGEYAFTNIPLTTNQQFNGITVKEKLIKIIDPLYVFYWVQSLKKVMINKSGKTTFPFLSKKKLGEFLIPIPPSCEQKRIVKKLEQILPLIKSLSIE